MHREVSSDCLRRDDLARIAARHRGHPVNHCRQAACGGFRSAVRRSTLAATNELHDWQFWAGLAKVVYALGATTIDL